MPGRSLTFRSMCPVIFLPTRAPGTSRSRRLDSRPQRCSALARGVVILAVAVVAGLVVHLFGPALDHGMGERAHAPSHGVAAESQAAIHAPIELTADDEGHDEAGCASLVGVSTGTVAPAAGCAPSAWLPPLYRELSPVLAASVQPAHPVEPLLRNPGLQRI